MREAAAESGATEPAARRKIFVPPAYGNPAASMSDVRTRERRALRVSVSEFGGEVAIRVDPGSERQLAI